ncbi:hypothetical protein [Ephemeroptericola cinctiostellae]|uniref:hypothetical protein n=1 Tax=Ephemeroptericola cinctiostellae TaxID=2268024 RepID=UPI000DF776B7|nr:hypothetical protein [Ephemeroptericola cinctiostellae]
MDNSRFDIYATMGLLLTMWFAGCLHFTANSWVGAAFLCFLTLPVFAIIATPLGGLIVLALNVFANSSKKAAK